MNYHSDKPHCTILFIFVTLYLSYILVPMNYFMPYVYCCRINIFNAIWKKYKNNQSKSLRNLLNTKQTRYIIILLIIIIVYTIIIYYSAYRRKPAHIRYFIFPNFSTCPAEPYIIVKRLVRTIFITKYQRWYTTIVQLLLFDVFVAFFHISLSYKTPHTLSPQLKSGIRVEKLQLSSEKWFSDVVCIP